MFQNIRCWTSCLLCKVKGAHWTQQADIHRNAKKIFKSMRVTANACSWSYLWESMKWFLTELNLKMPTENLTAQYKPRCSLLLITEQRMHNFELYPKNVSEEVLIHSTPSRAMVWVGAAKFQEVVRGMRTFTVQKAVEFFLGVWTLQQFPGILRQIPWTLWCFQGCKET
jgi:hypothetical protein